jgi:hypothetical protein
MALTPAEKQRRYRERQSTRAASRLDVVERELRQKAEHCSELPDQERIDLADKLADLAMQLQWRARALAELAYEVRGGRVPPGFPP